ncbi:hypothetical protein ACFSTA_19495 [Ornithinibacillus salinisoli]|uniref:DUF4367 domain-containing protein n=1 Tax=Ornithinibacillus salinisoli TaxID=1848459 RepID=A0ABW4W6T2_9BACI
MRKYIIALVLWLLIIGVACYVVFNSSSQELSLVNEQFDLTFEDANELTELELIEVNGIPFDYESTVNIYNYKLGSKEVQKVAIINYNSEENLGLNLIISPTDGSLQNEENDVEFNPDNKMELSEGTIAYYGEKDLGERIRFVNDGISYGLYHLTQSEDPYGPEEMLQLAENLLKALQ